MIYEITAAGGNGTIIETNTVYKNLAERGNDLLKLTTTAEQAGFVKGQSFAMAGGEFCGNGSRAAAIVMTNFKSGKVKYAASGFENTVEADVRKRSKNSFDVSAKFKGLKYRVKEKGDCKVVKFDGITHIIIENMTFPKNARDVLFSKITKFGLTNEPAVGLIYLSGNRITPLVYVKQVNTIYRETACGSGAIAVFVACGIKRVIQPTNQPIFVSQTGDAIVLSSEMTVADKKSEIYDSLFDDILGYDDVVKQAAIECGEEMAKIEVDFVGAKEEFEPIARKTVVEMLNKAQKRLPKGLKLQVVNGYRPISVQKSLFEQEMARCADKIPNQLERKRYVHKYSVAAPECAGHPTGGAVDVQITKNGTPLDFGTAIWIFGRDTMSFSPFASKEAQGNRLLLRSVMLDVGFAPFNGEWWHFSYGDQEWAAYYDRPNAVYKQV
jgi:D-alanyl-D-alanine dipeptidase